MTNVIAFRAAAKESRLRADRSGPAAILFFTGVRYIREDAEPEAAASARPAKSRAKPPQNSSRDERRQA